MTVVSTHQQPYTKAPDYRPDIDGLRAIAVLSVLVFHAFPSLAPGGFTGVDIFFVISGYLISSHILTELAAGSFSIKTFYVRRIKRIFPALTLILIFCIAAGWLILTPGEYELMGRPTAGGAGFVANFVFWKEAGYFDAAADTKPLLHLWSLGIEEQFYIVWPFMLALLWKRARQMVGKAILVLLAVSLIYSIWLVQRDVTADFYSPLTRFWELALGAGLAYGVLHKQLEIGNPHRQLLGWIGFALIVAAVYAIEANSRFPGAWALLPTLGAALLIYTGNAAWINRHVLASRPLVWIGLISYPLYLWHWPLLSFARIMESETPSATVRIWMLALSVALAWLTYRFVERPIRSRSGQQAKKAVIVLCIVMLLIFIAGIAIRKLDGMKFRALSQLNGDVSTLTLGSDRAALGKNCGLPDAQKKNFQFCLSHSNEAPQFAVVGDSKAEALYYGLAREALPGMHGVLIGSVLPPSPDVAATDREQAKSLLAFQTVHDHPSIKAVLLTIALRDIFPIDNDTGFVKGDAAAIAAISANKLASYSQAIRKLEQAGKRVIFVLDNPTLPDPRSCISGGLTSSPFLNQFLRRKPNPHCTLTHTGHLAGTAAYLKFAKSLANANPDLTVYDPTPFLCDIPRNECASTRDGKFLYSYSDHISDYANSEIAKDLLPRIGKLAR